MLSGCRSRETGDMPAAEGLHPASPQPMSVDGETAVSAAWMLESQVGQHLFWSKMPGRSSSSRHCMR